MGFEQETEAALDGAVDEEVAEADLYCRVDVKFRLLDGNDAGAVVLRGDHYR